jgi:hypothetical protein
MSCIVEGFRDLFRFLRLWEHLRLGHGSCFDSAATTDCSLSEGPMPSGSLDTM